METMLLRPSKVLKSYSNNELGILFQLLKDKYKEELFLLDLLTNLKMFLNPTNSSELTIFSRYIKEDPYKSYEPYGESKYFVLFYVGSNSLDFQFCSRHLNNFLHQATLREMPLLINTYFISTFAKWRLQIGK